MKPLVGVFSATFALPAAMAFESWAAILCCFGYAVLFLAVATRTFTCYVFTAAAFVVSVIAIRARDDNFELTGVVVGSLLLVSLFHLIRHEEPHADPGQRA